MGKAGPPNQHQRNDHAVQQAHRCGRGLATSVANAEALGLSRRSVPALITSRIMIPKYRNRALIQLACALVLTALLVFWISLIVRQGIQHRNENYMALLLVLYLGCWTMWMIASYSLAKAKGYSGEMAGGIFVFLMVIAFCFPIAAILFPVAVIFGLDDKTRRRLRRF